MIYIDDVPLICYHFHGISRVFKNYYDLGFSSYERLDPAVKKLLYKPYINCILKIEQDIKVNKLNYIFADRKSSKHIKDQLSMVSKFREYIKNMKSVYKNGIMRIS